jgi:chromosome segregation ATPase
MSFDENDDFPDYGNEKNKELNEKVRETRKHIKLIDKYIQENKERYRLLDEHFTDIKAVSGNNPKEIKTTELAIEDKQREHEFKNHMNRLLKKKIVKLEKETRNFDRISEEQQSKVNDVQQKIFEGNQLLEKLKSQINLNQEDMEKWMLAAKQKKEDNLMLEKYKRSDETKVKEIGLEIQRLTVERGKLERNLANQITETKACQIEVDKLVEEFNYHSEERQRVFSQWDSVVANLAKRNELQLEIGDKVARLEHEIREKQDKVEEKGRYLRREKEQNNLKKEEIKKLERENFQEKNKNHNKLKEVEDFMAQIKIIQNRLSGRARELESNLGNI